MSIEPGQPGTELQDGMARIQQVIPQASGGMAMASTEEITQAIPGYVNPGNAASDASNLIGRAIESGVQAAAQAAPKGPNPTPLILAVLAFVGYLILKGKVKV